MKNGNKKFKHMKTFETHSENKGEIIKGEFVEMNVMENGLGLMLTLTPDGIEEVADIGTDEDRFIEIFEDIQVNSDWMFHLDMGNSGFGLTEAPGFTAGYVQNDDGEFASTHDDSAVYYYKDYVIKNFMSELYPNGSVIFKKG